MPLAERFVCAAQGIWRANRSTAAQLAKAICACRFEANQNRKTINHFERWRDVNCATFAKPLPAYHSGLVGIWNWRARDDSNVASLFGAPDPQWKHGWSLLDLGTGSGVLALAAKCFGAGSVTGIDNDPAAISVAKSNARLNKIRGASFQLGDLRKQKPVQKADVITANLYNDLLIKILPKLNASRWLILSGILRSQRHESGRALQRNQYDIVETRRRGKWVAILARRTDAVRPPELKSPNFCGDHRPPLQ
jgi:hypothetical protein